ncbi:helix-turn-helix domain-containing protein [Chitinophaga nivalis]|uniref:Helix-turn-helix domain-containing protein n=1 Tax=Chitinophaga nivalis TaxID=2991709 RepID=A0ABT3IQZ0_9BACT|nr:helix-turn-helix domain-containing protein [Chitinophaga nivalis]MCW3463936.1 helix-turn-helix domain-containing protein [Chitinophaga nivalis]MCW3486374.1 helix-turn-helix domain-containing protein [Chitinophaga nivalis]
MDVLLKKTSYQPPPQLRPYIDRCWTCEGMAAGDAQPTMAAGTGAEMIFQLKAPMTIVAKDSTFYTPPVHTIYCIRHQYYKARINHTHSFIAVRFKAGAIRHFCPSPVAAITEQFPDINMLYGDEGKRLTESLYNSNSLSQQLALIWDFLLRLLNNYHRPHTLVDEAVRQLYYNRELPDLITFSASLGSSYRQFERLFINYIGVTPKSFQQTARLNNTLKHLLFREISNYLPVAFDFGYYDQSHFIKACRRFFGDKPVAILSPAGRNQHFYLPSFNASGSIDRK